MRAERALALAQPLHDRGDRDDRGVAGEDRIGAHVALDVGKQLLLKRQILRHRLDDVIGVAHRLGEIGARLHPRDRALVVAEVAQVGGNPRFRRIEILRDRIGDRDVVAGKRKHLRDAMAHQPGAERRRCARFAANVRQPAV